MRKKIYVDTIATHAEEHLDEICAEYLARGPWGKNFFQFASRIKYWRITQAIVGNITLQYLRTLFLGIGGGLFDDHGKKSKKSCTRLMAQYLKIETLPVFLKLIPVIDQHDKGHAKIRDQMTLPNIVNNMHRFGGFSSKQIYDWCVFGIEAILKSEADLFAQVKSRFSDISHVQTRKEKVKEVFLETERTWLHLNVLSIAKLMSSEDAANWVKDAELANQAQKQAFQKAKEVAPNYIHTIDTPRGPVKILIIKDTEGEHADYGICFDAVSRNLRCDLFIMKNHRGNLIIAANPSFRGNLRKLFASIKCAEACKRDIELTDKEAWQEGTLDKLPMIHIHEGGEFTRLYNGSTTRTDIEPLLLTCDEIKYLLLDFLSKLSPPTIQRPKELLSVDPEIFLPGKFAGTLSGHT